jgi:hypothetical protein
MQAMSGDPAITPEDLLERFPVPSAAERHVRGDFRDEYDPGRQFNKLRAEQGFRDQAHLDAFYAYHDHVQAGPETGCGCGTPGPGYDAPDGWQPTINICPDGRALSEASR